MTGITEGMTPEEVVALVGPPYNTMSSDEFEATFTSVARLGSRPSGAVDQLGRREPISWFYPGLPEGGSTLVDFRNGVVETIDVRNSPSPAGENGSTRHEWARQLVVRHLERVSRGEPPLGFTSTAAWRRMSSTEVLDFVLDVSDSAYQPVPGRIGGNARRFGELTVLVSMFDTTDSKGIRRMLPGGYLAQFLWLAHQFRVRPGETNIAHWMLCHDRDHQSETVHLSYAPNTQESRSHLLPTDLLTWRERRKYLR